MSLVHYNQSFDTRDATDFPLNRSSKRQSLRHQSVPSEGWHSLSDLRAGPSNLSLPIINTRCIASDQSNRRLLHLRFQIRCLPTLGQFLQRVRQNVTLHGLPRMRHLLLVIRGHADSIAARMDWVAIGGGVVVWRGTAARWLSSCCLQLSQMHIDDLRERGGHGGGYPAYSVRTCVARFAFSGKSVKPALNPRDPEHERPSLPARGLYAPGIRQRRVPRSQY